LELVKSVWKFRGFILESIKRDFQSKYQNSLIGSIWAIINPLATIVVYTVIFSEVMKAKLPDVSGEYAYSVYLCAGVLTWGFFSEVVNRAQNMFIENANLLKKLSFPRFCLPVIVLSSALVNFLIIFSLFTVFLLVGNVFPGVVFVSILPLMLLLSFFAIGLGITLGVLNVFFRDVGQLTGIILTFWFWLTPIVYPAALLSEKLNFLLTYNPITPLILAFQTVLVNASWPEWGSLITIFFITVALNLVGLILFRKHAGDMVDEL
jgi:lipopolysaccharide transport system permease protein